MMYTDFHVHTNFCDGKNSPEEMVLAAIDKGLSAIGLVAHSELDIKDNSWCLKRERYSEFIKQVRELTVKYMDKIVVLVGLEQDFYSPAPPDDVKFDYIIGSVHLLEKDGELHCFDASEDEFVRIKHEVFEDDMKSMYECYYQTLSRINEKVQCDIVGHFDLIGKYNDAFKYFNEEKKEYVEAYMPCLKILAKQDMTFEVNTGCMSRGTRGRPYPCQGALEEILLMNCDIILASDAHRKEDIAYAFENFIDEDQE